MFYQNHTQLIEVPDYGQIGAGNVVNFLPKQKKRWIATPPTLNPFEKFVTYTVSGNSLCERGIKDGDVFICRTKFELSEINKSSVCVLLIHNSELTVKMVSFNDDETVTVRAAHPDFPDWVYLKDEIEIKALVCELQRKI